MFLKKKKSIHQFLSNRSNSFTFFTPADFFAFTSFSTKKKKEKRKNRKDETKKKNDSATNVRHDNHNT